VVNIMSFFY